MMIRTVPVIVIIALLGLTYWKFSSTNLPILSQSSSSKIEQRLSALENALVEIKANLVNSKANSSSPPSPTNNQSLSERISALERSVEQLKNQKSTTPTQSVSKPPAYIPLGSGGVLGDRGWSNLPGYETSIDAADYAGYSGMQFEVTFRMTEIIGTGYARLYNSTDNSAVSPEISISSDQFSLYTSGSFKLPSGRKTYKLQMKSTEGKDLEFQNARIKVSF